MFSTKILPSLLLLFIGRVLASPTPLHPSTGPEFDRNIERRAVTPLSTTQLSSLKPFTQFARAAYCGASELQGWRCGEACAANADFQPTLVGGDGNAIQIYFVGYWPSQDTIVIAHEGTDPTKLLSDLTDIDFFLWGLDKSLFPGTPSGVEVHEGFRDAHARTASKILAEVKRLMSSKGTKKIAIVGHSLGGALAELDALFLTLNLPADTSIKAITYGTPRVGNPEFATFFDSKVPNFKRVNNQKDVIPIVPGRFLGFQHPKGEVHIISPGNAVSCPGNDDEVDTQCQISSVPNIFEGSILDHLGSYEGVYIGTIFCT